MTVVTLNSKRSNNQFDLFWDLIILRAEELGVVLVGLSYPGKESSLAGMMMAHPVEIFHQHPRHISSQLTLKLLTL